MKPQILATAMALALPGWTLCAQDATTPPPAVTPPAQEASPAPNKPSAPAPAPDKPHHTGGIFAALDTNHDGVIDADELNHAADALRKLDLNGDGKLELDEVRPPGGDHRKSSENAREGGPRPDAALPGQPGSRPPEGGPRGNREDRGPQGREDRHPGPDGANARGGGPGPDDRGPRAFGQNERRGGPPSQDLRREGPPSEPRGEGRRGGYGSPFAWNEGRPQWQPRHHHHHHEFPFQPGGPRFQPGGRNDDPRFAQGGQNYGGGNRPGPRPPWEGWAPQSDRHSRDGWAMGPRMDGPRGWAAPQGPGEFHHEARGSEFPDERRDFQRPRGEGGRDRFDGPRGGPQSDNRQFEGGPRDGGPRGGGGPGEWQPRSSGPRHGFGPPPQGGSDREQELRRPPGPSGQPGQGGPDGPRPPRREHEGPGPQGAEDERPFDPAPV